MLSLNDGSPKAAAMLAKESASEFSAPTGVPLPGGGAPLPLNVEPSKDKSALSGMSNGLNVVGDEQRIECACSARREIGQRPGSRNDVETEPSPREVDANKEAPIGARLAGNRRVGQG